VKAKYLIRLVLLLVCLSVAAADARTSSPRRATSRTETLRSRLIGAHTRSAASCQACARDTSAGSPGAIQLGGPFRSYNPCPATGATTGPCAGYVIDHIQALKHGGADSPDNMQWQTREAAKAKDRVE
jgi:hypothetical protein